mmetsp:Transcript_42401/g.106978  ORF Transcript_42401/g.106978 Transcript_42401/m.106978 type:complete len:243 (+) Transcript_42401:1541-2269(+)
MGRLLLRLAGQAGSCDFVHILLPMTRPTMDARPGRGSSNTNVCRRPNDMSVGVYVGGQRRQLGRWSSLLPTSALRSEKCSDRLRVSTGFAMRSSSLRPIALPPFFARRASRMFGSERIGVVARSFNGGLGVPNPSPSLSGAEKVTDDADADVDSRDTRGPTGSWRKPSCCRMCISRFSFELKSGDWAMGVSDEPRRAVAAAGGRVGTDGERRGDAVASAASSSSASSAVERASAFGLDVKVR